MIAVCVYVEVFTKAELFFLTYMIYALSTLWVTAWSQALQARLLLDQQTLHMSAIHHEIKTPLQVILSFFLTFFCLEVSPKQKN
jgi:hypothetical protein